MRFLPVLGAFVLLAALFAGLDRVPTLDEREARDAEVARSLIAENEMLTPLEGLSPRFEKPILAYVVNVFAERSGPAAPVRTRQARAAIAILLVIVVGSIGAEHFGARAGWLAACVLSSGLALPLAIWTDTAQLFGALLSWTGVASFADAAFGRPSGRDARLVVGWGALAAACVISGPLAMLWPVAAVVLYSALSGDRGLIGRIRPLAGSILVLGISLPWYGAMIERHGLAFAREALVFPYGATARGAWYASPMLALSLLIAGLLPWSALLPAAIRHAAAWWRAPRGSANAAGASRGDAGATSPGSATSGGVTAARDAGSRESREEHAAHFFVACLVAGFVPAALYPAPPMTAVLPALAAAALICARFLDHALEDPARLARPLTRAALMLGLAGTSAAVFLSVLAREIRDASDPLRVVTVVLFVSAWLPFLAAWLGRTRVAALLFAVPVAATTPLVTLRVLPAMRDYFSAGIVARAMNVASPGNATLVVLDDDRPTLRLELARNRVRASSPAEAWTHRATDGYAYVAFRALRERQLAAAAPGPIEILLRSPTLVLARIEIPAPPAR